MFDLIFRTTLKQGLFLTKKKALLLAIIAVTAFTILVTNSSLEISPLMTEDENYANFSYKFIRLYNQVNLTGPTVNPIKNLVTWQHDLSNQNVCNETDPFIINVVPSAIWHFKQRNMIRQTWGEKKLYPYTRMRTIFVLGKTLNTTLQTLVEEEIQTYEDIIQYDLVDSYRNLTYKTISWMSWVREFCPQAPWVAKVDDDVLVNPFHLKAYLANELKKNSSPVEIHGRLRTKNKAFRAGKWNVTKAEYNLDYYPPFVLGPAYIVSSNAVDLLLEYAAYTPILWLEDVYTTGLVASAAGIKRVQADHTLYTKKISKKLYSNKLTFLIGADEKRKKLAWNGIMKYSPLKKKR